MDSLHRGDGIAPVRIQMTTILEKLKAEWESWQTSVKLRDAARQSAKKTLKDREIELKRAKRVLYLITKDWNQARLMEKKTKTKYKTFLSSRRQWAKYNMGKVFATMEAKA